MQKLLLKQSMSLWDLGNPVFDKLDALLAYAMMSINAVKGVEIGSGFGVVTQKGSEGRDEIMPDGFTSNNSGGTLGRYFFWSRYSS